MAVLEEDTATTYRSSNLFNNAESFVCALLPHRQSLSITRRNSCSSFWPCLALGLFSAL
jgi:hypothetical protein